MNQTIHIFKKDLRRFTWEILLSFLVLAVYGWCQPALWEPPDPYYLSGGSALARYMGANFIGFIMLLVWMLMVVRLVNEESPAGDRQFWVTRPYRWSSLLAAKALFVIVVINIPLLVVQLGLLKVAGFVPLHHWLNLIYINLGLDALLLPFAALAAISGGRTQLTRAAIVALLFLIGWSALGSWRLISVDIHLYANPRWDWGEGIVVIGVPLAVIVLQYARRKTVRARLILLGGALTLLLLSAVEPKNVLNDAEYPLLSGETYFQMNMGAAPESQKNRHASISALGKNDKIVMVDLNLYGGGMEEGRIAEVKAVNVTLRAPDGTIWNSGWQHLYTVMEHQENEAPVPSQRDLRRFNSLFEVDRSFFDRYKEVSVSAHVETAATLFRDKTLPLMPQDNELALPGIGLCVIGGRPHPLYYCRTDLDRLPLLGITDKFFKSCPPAQDELLHPPAKSTAWVLGGGQVGLSPVAPFIPFLVRDFDVMQSQTFVSCKDTPVTFRQPEKVRQFRIEKDFQGIKLADLVYQQ